MYQFNATLKSNHTIEVESNTYWSCKVEGNFKLSKYDYSGDCVINIIIPDDIMFVEGTVYFSYGDERCKYPEIEVFLNNDCYIETYPNYVVCDDEKTIFFYYEDARETFNISVLCFGQWNARSSNLDYITTNNELIVISPDSDEGELTITPQNDCNGENVIHVKLIKKP